MDEATANALRNEMMAYRETQKARPRMSELKDAAVAKLEREIIKSQPFADNDGYSISDPMLTIAEAAELVRRAKLYPRLVERLKEDEHLIHYESGMSSAYCPCCQLMDQHFPNCKRVALLRDCEVIGGKSDQEPTST